MKCRYLLSLVSMIFCFTPSALAEPRSDPPKGWVIAEQISATWTCQDHLGVKRTPVYFYPWSMKKHSAAFAVEQLNKWRLRYKRCQSRIDRKKWEWNWQISVPYTGQQLARCESSYNWWAEGSSSDGSFYSAFNISRSSYDEDAHLMGVRGWHEGPGVPSPWEQWQAAIGHYKIHHGGWTGNCYGIMHG